MSNFKVHTQIPAHTVLLEELNNELLAIGGKSSKVIDTTQLGLSGTTGGPGSPDNSGSSSIGGGIGTGFPDFLAPIQLGTPSGSVLASGATYTYSVDLGAAYKQVIISRFQWVGGASAQAKRPSLVVGSSSFNDTNYGACLLVSTDPTKTIRAFSLARSESKEGSITDLAAPVFSNQSDVGVALGYGSKTKDSVFDHTNVYGKKFEIVNAWLDGNNLKVEVKNCDSVSIDLSGYTGVALVYGYLGDDKYVTIAGNNVIVVCGDTVGAPWAPGTYTKDGGITWAYFPNTPSNEYSLNPVMMTAKPNPAQADEFFLTFCDYNWNVFQYDSSANAWSQLGTNLWPFNPWNWNTPGARSASRDANPFQARFGSKLLDYNENVALVANFEQLLVRLEKSTDNFHSFNNIFRVEDVFEGVTDDVGSRYNGYSTSRVKLVDDNTYFLAFPFYYSGIEPVSSGIDNDTHNALIKTINGGSNWTRLLENHPEFKYGSKVAIDVSDDGLDIVIVAISTGNPYNPYPAGTAVFNESLDGGATWRFTTGNWSVISTTSSNQYQQTNNLTISETAIVKAHDNSFVCIMRDSVNKPAISRSPDGITWSPLVELEPWASNYAPPDDSARAYCGFDSNQYFFAFCGYGYVGNTSDSRLLKGSTVNTFTNWGVWAFK
jgi:hypothetical protein